MKIINIFPNQNIQSILNQFQNEIVSSEETIINIYAGIYNQRVHIIGQNLNILGHGIVIINNNLGAKQLGHNKTFYTATLLCEGDNIKITNLCISNNAGLGSEVGQSVALYLNGDNICLDHCTVFLPRYALFGTRNSG